MSYTWWGCSPDVARYPALVPLDRFFTVADPAGASTIAAADPLTVRLRGVFVREDRDWGWRGDNDLIVATTFQFGSEPPVRRLHYLGEEVALGWQGDFFHDVVLATSDVDARSLTLRVQVYDVDGVDDDLVAQVKTFAQTAAVVFPQLAPYAGVAGLAVPAFLNLVDNLDEHDPIFDGRLKLESDKPGQGFNLLQPGYFVGLKRPSGDGLSLHNNLRLRRGDQTFEDCSYVVVGVERDYKPQQVAEIDQKAAKLLAELGGKGQSGRASLEFLQETMQGYAAYKKLERARSLLRKPTRTPAEEALLERLRADEAVGPYLPSLTN